MAKREVAVRVAVRVRPLLEGEMLRGRGEVAECVRVVSQKQLVLGGEQSFTFDRVLLPESTQEETYHKCASSLVHSTLEGFNATLLAYGQTGSGKTYTLGSGAEVEWNGEREGMIPRALNDIFKGLQSLPDTLSHTVCVSYVEVYKEELRDLLDSGTTARKTLQLREQENGNIVVQGLLEVEVTSASEALSWLQSGNVARITGSTNMNQRSSRSHVIFTVHIDHVKLHSPTTSSSSSSLGAQRQSSAASSLGGKQSAASESHPVSNHHHHHRVTSKFHFVDLAGCERVGRTGNTGERFKESVHINTGLLALGNVISALGDPKRKSQHVPYRDSKITRLLKDSLGGNTKTVMLACLSPATSNYAETLNTLKYAQRARHIKNKPVVNLDQEAQEVEHMRTQIAALREELSRTRSIAPSPSVPMTPLAHHPQRVGVDVVELQRKIAQLERELERCQMDIATDEEMFAERELELAGLREQVSTLTAEKTRLWKDVSGYVEREQTLQEEIQQLTLRVTQLERELTVGRGRGTEQLTMPTHPVDETAKEDASPTSPQEHSTPSDSEGTATGSMQLEKGRVKPVLDLSLQGLLSSLAARNNKLAAEVMKHTKPLSDTWSAGVSDNRQLSSQQDEVHLDHHHSRHRQQQLVGRSSAGVPGQMRSLREKEAVVEEHLEGMVQRRRALEQLEKELADRERSLAEREAVLAERDMLDVKRLRASHMAHKEMVRASMKLSAVESSISEREAGWREGGVPAEQLGQGTQLQTLQGERESLLKEVRELQNRMKSESFLSLEEERRLAELSEWVDVMDAALEYRRRQFSARQKRCVLSSLEQKGGGVREVLKVLTLEDTRHLMAVYLNKMAGLRLKLEDAEQLNQECRIQLKEKDDLVSTLERCLRHCRSELQRRLALQEREHRKQLEVAAREEGQEGGTGKSLLEEKVHELEKELYYYKKTSRDLKKRLRAHMQSAPRGQSDPSKGPLKANTAVQSSKGEELCGVSSGGEDRCVSQSQPQPIGCKEERGGGTATATASAQSDVLKVVRKSKKELRQLSAEEVTRRIKGTSVTHTVN